MCDCFLWKRTHFTEPISSNSMKFDRNHFHQKLICAIIKFIMTIISARSPPHINMTMNWIINFLKLNRFLECPGKKEPIQLQYMHYFLFLFLGHIFESPYFQERRDETNVSIDLLQNIMNCVVEFHMFYENVCNWIAYCNSIRWQFVKK